MPKILERAVRQIQAKGKDKSAAYAIATKGLQRSGVLKPDTQDLTPKGAKRQAMSPAARAKDRAAKSSGRPADAYDYSKKTNRATLK